MDGVRTTIIGRPRPLTGPRRADHTYTLICDEPQKGRPAPLATHETNLLAGTDHGEDQSARQHQSDQV